MNVEKRRQNFLYSISYTFPTTLQDIGIRYGRQVVPAVLLSPT